MTDRLTLTRALEAGGMESPAAERIATEIYDAIHDNVATKQDLREQEQRLSARIDQVEHRLSGRLDLVEHRLVTRLGGLGVVLAGLLIAALRLWR